jgi:hypothetical protein
MGRKRGLLASLAILLYLATVAGLVYLSYRVSPPVNADQWKEFGVRTGIALTACGAFYGFILSLITLGAQTKAAQELEKLKGRITRQTNFLNLALNAKSVAYDKLFVASNHCYRELQYLDAGQYDQKRAEECEKSLREAEGLSANLEEDDRVIVSDMVQVVVNIIDEANEVKPNDKQKKEKYDAIWHKNVAKFGDAMNRLRDRSLFQGEDVRAQISDEESDHE